MNKLYQTFQSLYSLHNSPWTILFHTTFVIKFVVKYLKTSSFSGSSSAETLLWQKQLILAPFYLKSISLFLISATLLYLSRITSCMSAVGEETSEPKTSLRWKLFCYSSPSHITPETFVSTTNLQGLTHSNPSKSTNQVTLSNEHMNQVFWD